MYFVPNKFPAGGKGIEAQVPVAEVELSYMVLGPEISRTEGQSLKDQAIALRNINEMESRRVREEGSLFPMGL